MHFEQADMHAPMHSGEIKLGAMMRYASHPDAVSVGQQVIMRMPPGRIRSPCPLPHLEKYESTGFGMPNLSPSTARKHIDTAGMKTPSDSKTAN